MSQNPSLYLSHTSELIYCLSNKKIESLHPHFPAVLDNQVKDFISTEDLPQRTINLKKKYNLKKIEPTDTIRDVVEKMYCFRPF